MSPVDDIDRTEQIDPRRIAILGLWTTLFAILFTVLLIGDTVTASTF